MMGETHARHEAPAPVEFEEPWIREKFESELKARGLTSVMPEQAYKDPNYEWDYGEDGE